MVQGSPTTPTSLKNLPIACKHTKENGEKKYEKTSDCCVVSLESRHQWEEVGVV